MLKVNCSSHFSEGRGSRSSRSKLTELKKLEEHIELSVNKFIIIAFVWAHVSRGLTEPTELTRLIHFTDVTDLVSSTTIKIQLTTRPKNKTNYSSETVNYLNENSTGVPCSLLELMKVMEGSL